MDRIPLLLLALFIACLLALASDSSKEPNTVKGLSFFSPKSSDDFKAAPIVEITRANHKFFVGSKKCTIIFSSPMFPALENVSAVQTLRGIARQLAREFRSNANVLIGHIAADMDEKTLVFPYADHDYFKKIVLASQWEVPLVIATRSQKGIRISGAAEAKVERSIESIRGWIEKKCKELSLLSNPEFDHASLSAIFKTNKTLALLADGFDLVSDQMKHWIQDYCTDYPLPKDIPVNVTVLDAKTTSMKKFLCFHAFAGRPLILKNAMDHWPAISKWKPSGPWVDMMSSARLSTDIGVEGSWNGPQMSSVEYFDYMQSNAAERARFRQENASMPPWSSIYAYTHQHTKTENGFVADFMWADFEAPPIINRQNWFRYMGDCHKMMTVTFWATEGARQSNHQDDFGSSKWHAQIYGKKRWILHPPEESQKLYYGRVDPFEPDYERYPDYKGVKRVEFVLEEGDLLFFSAGWWHGTQALSNALSIAQNILSEHNYMEFRRTSRKACEPGGSHGIYSPWCACFRRTYGKWDALYKKWLNDMKDHVPGQDYDFSKFQNHHEDPTDHIHVDLQGSIDSVLESVNKDVRHFHENKEFPIDTFHPDL